MHKHIPLLCSTPVVESLIAKRKTQTRRTKGLENIQSIGENSNAPGWFIDELGNAIKCPYGNVGDVIWVREEHKISYLPKTKEWLIEYKDGFLKTYYYKKLSIALNRKLQKRKTLGKWQRARFLPKELSRLFLKIKSITVERLNSISEADAIAEGIESCIADKEKFGCRAMGMRLYRDYERKDNSLKDYPCNGFDNPILSFQTLWESINGKDSWNANPLVWVIEFEQIEKPDGFV